MSEFRGERSSKSLAAVAAVSMMLAFGVLAAVVTSNMSSPAAGRAHTAQPAAAAHTAVPPYDMPGARGFRVGAHL